MAHLRFDRGDAVGAADQRLSTSALLAPGAITTMKHNSITISVFLASLVSVVCSADSILIKNADIYNALGMSAQTHLYLDNGIISGLGDSAPTSADMIIEGRGMSVTAGLFNAATHIGTVEIEQIEGTTADKTTTKR